MRRSMLEREPELADLVAATQEAASGRGCVVLVHGEAGIGKSSLVAALRDSVPDTVRVLTGYCDDLLTPPTLGPFHDLTHSVGTELRHALEEGADRDRLLTTLGAELRDAGRPTAMIVEDVHWADDATLDALRYLARRIAGLPVALVLTYRDEAVSPEHPLRRLLGQLAGSDRLRRVSLRPLSPRAVKEMAASSPLDTDRLYAATAGNPCFVSEVLLHGYSDAVPATVVDAVLARVHQLGPDLHDTVEQLAVIPSAVDRQLAELLLGSNLDLLTAAEQRGLLTVTARQVAFRHEITRRAIVDSLPGARRTELNRRVLAVLTAAEGTELGRVVHHAAEAGDLDAIARFGPAAAREASRAGAHREAVAHYGLVLQEPGRFAPAERATLLEEYAIECYTLGDGERSVTAQLEAVELRRLLGAPEEVGAGLRWLSRMHWWNGQRPAAEHAAQQAIDTLTGTGDNRLLALAYSNQAQLHVSADRYAEAVEYGERATALARDVDAP
ncbi:ATP-binding protein [Streptomyces sp. 2A115]|uniref:ATP-binding protein n=1 Tax=Streptomyces sp. 2A115 TaxID=3457439 RepID=UPI003FD56E0C